MANETTSKQTHEQPKDIYGLFDDFLQKTIIEKKSFFVENQSIDNTIEALIDAYISNGLSNDNFNKEYEKVSYENKTIIDKEKTLFFKKSRLQIEVLSRKQDEELTKLKHFFVLLLWLRYVSIADTKNDTKNKIIGNWIGEINNQTNYFPSPLASYGMAQQQIDNEMVHLICLFSYLLSEKSNKKESNGDTKSIDEIKKQIINWINNKDSCKSNYIDDESRKNIWENRIDANKHLPVYNMLLHLCNKENYEPIAIQRHKESIVKNLYQEYLGKEEWNNIKNSYTKLDKIDSYIKKIKEEIKKEDSKFNNFWEQSVLEKWKGGYVANAYEILNQYQKQIIFYGAPGTGKTYNAKELIKEFIHANEGFEQSGNIEEDELSKFKFKVSQDEKITSQDIQKISLDNNLTDKIVIWEIVQFNQSFSYEDFIEGMRPQTDGGLKIVDGIFKQFANVAKQNPTKTFVFIIDEINRGKIDKIFGELLYLLEYRNESLKLHYSGEDFSIPENLYIVGTLNTADKSIALLDVALRRRFWFVRCEPQVTVLKKMFDIDDNTTITSDDNGDNVKRIAIKLFNLLNNDNKGILKELGDDASELKIGHSYFLKLLKNDAESNDIEPTFSDLKNIWFYSIIPLLEEYCSFNKKMLSDLFEKSSINKDLSNKSVFTLENLKSLK